MLVRPLVEVEQVADRLEVQREPARRAGRRVHVRVAGTKTSRRPSPFTSATAAPVCQPNVPKRRSRRRASLAERPVAVVPEQHVVRVRRDQQIRVPVAVEVRGDAAVALDARFACDARSRRRSARPCSRRGRSGEAASGLPRLGVRVRVRVHGEEVEAAVVVVVEPAEAAAHHPVHVVRHAEPESRPA